ncbi:hypothetical protein GCM10010399_06470 [Dactylosporangium fulvum]|uniref:Uncharacterized protein n=1 Tax=Dactylosporangium fulvum TaxID=53359 RepID=A0ABY5VUL4_9ACTN|nr:hypothetical protein [Dactylosporangium fulvum]UWP81488.1 hypothetical protein Dfulv_41280 [Dactylosporangium fulvum]
MAQVYTPVIRWRFLVTALLAVASAVTYLKRRFVLTQQLLRVMAVVGLFTGVIPGLLAFVAWHLARNSHA